MSVYAIILSAAPVITLREAQHNRTSDVPAMIKRVRQERGTLKYAAQTLQTVVIIALKTTAVSSTKHTYGHNNKRLQRSQRKAAAESQVFLECIDFAPWIFPDIQSRSLECGTTILPTVKTPTIPCTVLAPLLMGG